MQTKSTPASLYMAQTPAPRSYPALQGEHSAEVAIVGAGFTGLSTALHLAEKGIKAVVLDAHEPGWGASGRNGGQVNPGFKLEPGEITRLLGEDRAKRMIELGGHAPSYVGEVIRRHGISCDHDTRGALRVVRQVGELPLLTRSIEDWSGFGVKLALLDKHQTLERIGGGDYPGAILDARGGSLNPLAYASGLADAAAGLGASIHGQTCVLRIERAGGQWALATKKATVKARHVVLAMNGYADAVWPGLSKRLVPIYTGIAATAPLPERLASQILAGRHAVFESSWRVLYFRIDSENRLLMGGPGPQRDTASPSDYAYLVDAATHIYPQLRSTEWQYFWNGQVAVTKDHLPQLFEPAEGVIAAFGYNGRGIAMATAMGQIVARRIQGASAEELDVPLRSAEPYRFKPLWRPAAELAILRGRLQDRVNGLR